MTGLGFEPILINKISAFQLITLLNLKYHKNVRTILELKMCLILKQKHHESGVFVYLLGDKDSNLGYQGQNLVSYR